MLLMQPSWLLDGAMWAEMATNYYANATHPEFLTQLFATDAGYVPFPQRILALMFSAFPPASIPYAYTWSAIIATGLLVGSFSHPIFRQVIESDFLRLFVCIAVLMVADFEARTFVNFTYFVAFYAAALSALALVGRNSIIPSWAWLLPVLMISKPHALVALPALLFGAIRASGRFRNVVICTLVLVLLQALRLLASQNQGVMPLQTDISPLNRIQAIAGYFFGLLAKYIMGPRLDALDTTSIFISVVSGVILCAICLYLTTRTRSPARWIILSGLSLVLFDVILNCTALGIWWNSDFSLLKSVNVHRYTIAAYFGVVFIIAGFCSLIVENLSSRRYSRLAPAASGLFAGWFLIFGWHTYGIRIGQLPGSPVTGNSHWQQFSYGIENRGTAPLCVPIDPFGWVYGSHCRNLTQNVGWTTPYHFREIEAREAGIFPVVLPIPHEAIGRSNILALLALVRTTGSMEEPVHGSALITLNTGEQVTYRGENKVLPTGGTILLNGPSIVAESIQNVELQFDRPLNIAIQGTTKSGLPMVLWLGN